MFYKLFTKYQIIFNNFPSTLITVLHTPWVWLQIQTWIRIQIFGLTRVHYTGDSVQQPYPPPPHFSRHKTNEHDRHGHMTIKRHRCYGVFRNTIKLICPIQVNKFILVRWINGSLSSWNGFPEKKKKNLTTVYCSSSVWIIWAYSQLLS